MQTNFIEENLIHQQIAHLCAYIDSDSCTSLEFRRCAIANDDFDLLMKSLTKHAQPIISLIFNIQMIHEQSRFKLFLQMLRNCSNLLHLQVHGNNITDGMLAQLYGVLYEHCPKLNLLDVGDNQLTNKSIVHLGSLIVADDKRAGLEELILSANQSITHAGWTELFFSISFNSRLRRLALDYNLLDNNTIAMLSMIVASSRTLIHLDLECCQLTEYAGQLFLTLFTKYPVKLEELCLEKNPAMLETTRALIQECLGLKSRRSSVATEQPLPIHVPVQKDAISVTSDKEKPVKMDKKTETKTPSPSNAPTPPPPPPPAAAFVRGEPKTVSFNQRKQPERLLEIPQIKMREEEDDADIEELLPIDTPPYGVVGHRPHWNRV